MEERQGGRKLTKIVNRKIKNVTKLCPDMI